jgi:hypothetical protein
MDEVQNGHRIALSDTSMVQNSQGLVVFAAGFRFFMDV